MSNHDEMTDVVVVGGGLGGVAAAALAARAGRRVVVFEKARVAGGRAVTQARGEFLFNLGPHALYRSGRAMDVLRELGVEVKGGTPGASGGYAIEGGIKHTMPLGFVSLLTTDLVRLPAKLELGRLLASFHRIDPERWLDRTVRDWLESAVRHHDVRRLLAALVRLTTYANAPGQMSAGAAIRQLQLALAGNVAYLDGGWQSLVDALRATASAAGVEVVTGARVTAVEHDGAVRGVRLADGTMRAARAVIVAASPAETRELFRPGETVLDRWADAAVPIRAACLDVALSRLPVPTATFALGIDRPHYFSVHSAAARLAPAGAALIHLAKYLSPDSRSEPREDERELETLLDLVQPGWRDVLVDRRFMPSLVVSNAIATAAAGGTAGRPGPAVPGIANLYVVGDWVGPEGMLADATLASARLAVRALAQDATQQRLAAA
ncbi:MAG TPA: FAD-dependent oxidoreductase [Candidatus Bathyarchaeia archaeon]|nr:FAD-dependent oxidoreductase [Candidatus Bathyarchaeia archaeon]